ncbi:hypothetical protein [Embleya hyalina]|uniref:Uncharacterized protein n=1 Tax=Embleya hyalina TaxID=516124 RepID=A0A401Z5Z5_9ACTN|nr:hypothetical protein [Embleya hyalina]GCE02265.1 hypothetical protein EHYA_10042 [Embleya hyalina]
MAADRQGAARAAPGRVGSAGVAAGRAHVAVDASAGARVEQPGRTFRGVDRRSAAARGRRRLPRRSHVRHFVALGDLLDEQGWTLGDDARYVQLGVTSEADRQKGLKTAVSRFGGLNEPAHSVRPIGMTTEAGGGSIVGIASTAGFRGAPALSA